MTYSCVLFPGGLFVLSSFSRQILQVLQIPASPVYLTPFPPVDYKMIRSDFSRTPTITKECNIIHHEPGGGGVNF